MSQYKLEITDRAARKLISMVPDGWALRIKVQGGGCSGMTYRMELVPLTDEGNAPDSWEFLATVVDENRTFPVRVDKKSWLFLEGTTIDYEDGLNDTGFKYSNPKAKHTCGCGSSFS